MYPINNKISTDMEIYNDNSVTIHKIDNFEDSKTYGIDTFWCISLSEEWWRIHKSYNQDFLFIFCKNVPENNPNSKLSLSIDIPSGCCFLTNKENQQYKENSKEEKEALDLIGKDALDFLTNYISINYNK